MANTGSNFALRWLWGVPFTAAGVFIIYAALTGQMTSSSDALNTSPVLGVLAGLLFLAPGVWALQLPIWNRIKFPGDEQTKGLLAMGAFCLLIGTFMVIMSFVDDEEAFNAPRWVAALASSVFAIAGLIMVKTALFDHGVQPQNSLFNMILIAVLLTCFGVVATWVSIGPGDREFSGSVSIPFISFSGSTSEALGRLCFMPGALLLDFMAAAAWFHALKQLTKMIREGIRQPGESRQNALSLGALILLVAVIGALIALINYEQYLNRPR